MNENKNSRILHKFRQFLLTAFVLLFLVRTVPAQSISWTEIEPGIWKGVTGTPETYNLLTASGAKAYEPGLQQMGKAGFPLSQPEITATVADGKTYLHFPLEKEEQLYGFGLNFQTVHQRGKILRLHVDHYGGQDDGRTHAPTPFYVSSSGYGIFINSARYLEVYAGSAVRKDSHHPPEVKDRNTDKTWTAEPYSDAVEVLAPAAGVEIYVFAGPRALDAIRRFNLFNGGGCLPPRWGLGFTQRVEKMSTVENVKEEAAAFHEKGYPLDFIGLEPGQTTRKVILPKGRWYDFYTGKYAGDGQVITVSPGLDKIPVYVKDGAIIPMMPALLHAPKAGEKISLEIRHYGEKPGMYRLYDDDGETYDYEKGAYTWRTITVEKDKKGKWKGLISAPEKGKPNTVGAVTWKFMTE